ncbi:hypothetical protein PIB30_104685 [Stylosanthes scabra]|uniref:Uncharacterized protein n=1 Tax=Stylosanthes scabra TaxID=79078 RepID=A0ABU6UZ65_9FABA|nr:hypothetical protein [Stylosanthes scabra]
MRDRHYWLTHQTDKSVDMLLRGKIHQLEPPSTSESLSPEPHSMSYLSTALDGGATSRRRAASSFSSLDVLSHTCYSSSSFLSSVSASHRRPLIA